MHKMARSCILIANNKQTVQYLQKGGDKAAFFVSKKAHKIYELK